MYYVAATRARDLLVLPAPRTKSKTLRYATDELAAAADPARIRRFAPFQPGQIPLWGETVVLPAPRPIVGDAALQARLDAARTTFTDALRAATRPLATPTAVTLEAISGGADEELGLAAERSRKAETGRFGPVFGCTVHRALELVLADGTLTPALAVARAAQETGLTDHRDDAAADVHRALACLAQQGWLGTPGVTLATEYPLAMAWQDGKLLSGFIDLLAFTAEALLVIDFKTDVPLPGALAVAHPRYAAQLHLYGELLRRSRVAGDRRLRCGLLFTVSGELRWL